MKAKHTCPFRGFTSHFSIIGLSRDITNNKGGGYAGNFIFDSKEQAIE